MPKGKVYLTSVWATWCGACRSELKALEKVYKDWEAEYNFEFIAISIDVPTDHHKIFKMANDKNWDFKILHDEYAYVSKELDVFRLPQMYLVDKDGKIVYHNNSYHQSALETLEQKIKSLSLEQP